MNPSQLTIPMMFQKLAFHSFPLKSVLHLSIIAITVFSNAEANSTESPLPSPSATNTSHSSMTNLKHPPFSFFMHNVIGGSAPSERVVAGTIVNTQKPTLPFSKPNDNVFLIKGGIPLFDTNNGNSGGTTSTEVKDIGQNVVVSYNNKLPYVKPGQLPPRAILDKLLFGRITVIDDEITEGHELGSSVIGKAQGFHLASSMDGSSLTMTFSALLGDGDHEDEDTVSFFGVHRTAAAESYLAVVGGTGKYENARGYAKIERLHLPDQHTTNGVHIVDRITVFITV